MTNQREIHIKVVSKNEKDHIEAVNLLRNNFNLLPYKNQAWADLIHLTQDADENVRVTAANGLALIFPNIPDKKQAWADLHELIHSEDRNVLKIVTIAIGLIFFHIPDKQQAWEDLHCLLQNKDCSVQRRATSSLGLAFFHIPDKQQAWDDLHRLIENNNCNIRKRLASAIGTAFFHIPDKQQAWDDLHCLILDKDCDVRKIAVSALGLAFPRILDKEKAWDDLHKLIQDDDKDVRLHAANELGAVFPLVPCRKNAFEAICILTQDNDKMVQRRAIVAICGNFPLIPDQKIAWDYITHWIRNIKNNGEDIESNNSSIESVNKQAWEVIDQLTEKEYEYVQRRVAYSIASAIPFILDKGQAWNDIIKLILDGDLHARRGLAGALGIIFPLVPDREQAWKDLHNLSQNITEFRLYAASAIGTVFPHIPDKQQAVEDLLRLAQDNNGFVQAFANYSLGRVSIYNATEAENEKNFKEELRSAIGFFEKSLKETNFEPPRFCFPFYRSFYSIVFNEQDAEAEIKKYFAEAKEASIGSKSREKLLEAVENLSNALRELQKTWDFNEIKCNLDIYRRYCDRACELLEATEKKAPGATKLIRMGLPIIDERIKGILAEIEEKTKNLCKESHKTPFEKIGRSAYEQIKGLGKLDNEVRAEIKLYRLKNILQSMCIILPDESKEIICDQLDTMQDQELNEIVGTVMNALIAIQPQIINLKEKLIEKDKQIEFLRDSLIARLDNINYGVFHLKLNSGDTKLILLQIQNELKKLTIIEKDVKKFGISMTEMGQILDKNHQRLVQDIAYLCEEIETSLLPKLPQTEETQRILEKLQDLKQSRGEKWFSRAVDLASLIGFMLQLMT